MEDTSKPFSIPQTTIDWLLDSQTPSIRYFTYKNLLNRPDDDAMVQSTRTQIGNADYTKAILAEQDKAGFWYNPKHFYGPKYRSSHWAMLLLSELGAAPEMDALQKGADFMLRRMAESKDTYYSIDSYLDSTQSGFCCYWGNWLRYQLYAGNHDHPLVQQVIKIVSKDVMRHGRCEYNNHLPCAWGVIRSLFGLALIPDERRTTETHNAINEGSAFILNQFELTQANYPNPGKVHPLWFRLNYPLFYQADILFTLRVLAELGGLEKANVKNALAWLESKRKEDGTWRGSSPYKSRTHPFVSGMDGPERWVTLQALTVLKAANQGAR
jgi:hypothetical protein